MKEPNFRQASRAQLAEILFNDKDCPPHYRLAAEAEWRRREKIKHIRTQFKERRQYPQ